MKCNSVYKVQGGKLLKVALEAQDGKVAGIKISGDFFLHPEEAVELIEKGLQGTELDEGKLEGKAAEIVKQNSIQLFGFSPPDLAKAIMMAVQK